MKIKIKKVYYCDHCKKHYLSERWCKLHEEKCTMNPDRYCRLCDDGLDLNEVVPKWIEIYTHDDEQRFTPIESIRRVAGECPVCMLALIRQAGLLTDFNYKKELNNWWQHHNREKANYAG